MSTWRRAQVFLPLSINVVVFDPSPPRHPLELWLLLMYSCFMSVVRTRLSARRISLYQLQGTLLSLANNWALFLEGAWLWKRNSVLNLRRTLETLPLSLRKSNFCSSIKICWRVHVLKIARTCVCFLLAVTKVNLFLPAIIYGFALSPVYPTNYEARKISCSQNSSKLKRSLNWKGLSNEHKGAHVKPCRIVFLDKLCARG